MRSDVVAAPALSPVSSESRLEHFWALGKPRVVWLIVLTTAAGYWLGSPGSIRPGHFLLTLLGTALAAAGALGLNMLVEKDLDARMERTAGRPLPTGKLSDEQALAFGVSTIAFGLATLSLLVDPVAGLVTAVTVVTYLFAYTPLKRVSALCTVIGAFPGALPPVTGWAAATGGLSGGVWALFGIFFFWQLPHSLAIARLYREDYRQAGIQVLPVVDSGPATGRQAVLHSLGLVAASSLPALTGLAGPAAVAVVLLMGLLLLGLSLRLWREDSLRSARQLFLGSLLYVPAVLLALVLDRA